MKYIIAGKNEASGVVGNDSADLAVYFELGWEVVGSRIDIIRMIKTGEINNDETTIVTIEDRKFMYSSFCKNVISWEDFKSLALSGKLTGCDFTKDWTVERNFLFLNRDGRNEFWENKDSSPQSDSKYFRYYEDYDLITDGFEKNLSYLERIGVDEKFYVANLRFRDHCANRSSPQEWWRSLLSEISKVKGRKIYLVGHGAEKFVLNNNMEYVSRLQDYVTLIQDPRCCDVITSATGTCILAYSASKSPVHLIDHDNVSYVNQNNAVMGGQCSQFLKSPIFRYSRTDISAAGIQKILNSLR